MADQDKRSNTYSDDASTDEATQLKKRARRRLIGAAAMALLAAIILPMVMDHQPAPPLKDIQVRIPSPDEGVTQRVAPAKPVPIRKEEKPVPPPIAEPVAKPEQKPAPVVEQKTEPKVEPKPEPKTETVAKLAEEAWEVQLGAYQEPGRVKLLVGKLKELNIPTYTEKVDTPGGARTRVRAGPFPSQEAAEKARQRIKIVGVDGPVARKP
jgi:DedD protein